MKNFTELLKKFGRWLNDNYYGLRSWFWFVLFFMLIYIWGQIPNSGKDWSVWVRASVTGFSKENPSVFLLLTAFACLWLYLGDCRRQYQCELENRVRKLEEKPPVVIAVKSE